MALNYKKSARESISLKEHRYRMVFLIINTLFLMLAAILIGLGIWFLVERTYIASVLDSELYAVAAILMFAIGCTLLLIIGAGCLGVYRRSVWLILVYIVIIGIMELAVFISVILAIVFSSQFEFLIKDAMASTLKFRYGNNTHNITTNRVVTQAWDTMQVRLKCCAIEDKGWAIYQESTWYLHKLHSGQDKASIDVIPESCCRRLDRDWDYILNRDACIRPQAGPPRHPDSGSINQFLIYNGCFETGQESILEVIWLVLGFGLLILILVAISLASAVIIVRAIRKENKRSNRGQNYKEGRRNSRENVEYDSRAYKQYQQSGSSF